jgi:hypothetical protein
MLPTRMQPRNASCDVRPRDHRVDYDAVGADETQQVGAGPFWLLLVAPWTRVAEHAEILVEPFAEVESAAVSPTTCSS